VPTTIAGRVPGRMTQASAAERGAKAVSPALGLGAAAGVQVAPVSAAAAAARVARAALAIEVAPEDGPTINDVAFAQATTEEGAAQVEKSRAYGRNCGRKKATVSGRSAQSLETAEKYAEHVAKDVDRRSAELKKNDSKDNRG
jgi:cytosine/adenosine deaminase-related metal-dependent hydrolase